MSQISNVNLTAGDQAPDFTVKCQMPSGEIVDFSLKKELESGKKVLLVFYPGDMTPGCTIQLCGIRDVYSEYQAQNVTVLGVNPANAESHLKFIKMHKYPFGIIIDEDKNIRKLYGAEKKFINSLTTKRGVFLIDSSGKILFTQWGQQNDQEILEKLTNNSF